MLPQELRGRNYTLLEKTEEVPRTIIKERKRVAEQFGTLAKKPFKSYDDEAVLIKIFRGIEVFLGIL